MKRTAVNHNKTTYLQTLLKRPPFHVLGVLESIWQLTAKDFPRGDIGKISNARIAGCIGWDGDSDELVNALEMAGFIDPHPVHRLIVHDWPHHCEDSVHCYLARRFEKFADGTVPKFTRLTSVEKKGIVEKWEKIIAGEKVMIEKQGELFTENKSAYVESITTEVQTMPLPLPLPLPTTHTQDAPRQALKASESVTPVAGFKFPDALDVDEFHETWRMFKQHCRDKGKPHTRAQAEIQLTQLASRGLPGAIASLIATMNAGLCVPIDPPQKPIKKPDNVPREAKPETPEQKQKRLSDSKDMKEKAVQIGRIPLDQIRR